MTFSKRDLQQFHPLKGQGNELFDLTASSMQELYDEIGRTALAHVVSRDTTSFEEIGDSVRHAIQKHQGDGIVILSGAYQHTIGAITDLQKEFNIEYVPVGERQISTQTIYHGTEETGAERIKMQMGRDFGVTKHLGYENMEAARKAVESKPHDPAKKTLVVVALHETGLHGLDVYGKAAVGRTCSKLEEIIGNLDNKPSFLSYIQEDGHVENMRKTVTESGAEYPAFAFLQKIYRTGIPVEIGAFGHKDRAQGSGGKIRMGFGDEDNFDTSMFTRSRRSRIESFGEFPMIQETGARWFGDKHKKRDPHTPDGSAQGKK
jgi:hypothetical protein